jgi:hypothetical protein
MNYLFPDYTGRAGGCFELMWPITIVAKFTENEEIMKNL